MLVIRVRARRADARIQVAVRQVEHKIAARADHAPPFLERTSVILDVLEQMRRENEVLAGVFEIRKPFASLDDDVRLHLGAEQFNVLQVVDADKMRECLRRPAAKVQAFAARVLDDIPPHLASLVSHRIIRSPHRSGSDLGCDLRINRRCRLFFCHRLRAALFPSGRVRGDLIRRSDLRGCIRISRLAAGRKRLGIVFLLDDNLIAVNVEEGAVLLERGRVFACDMAIWLVLVQFHRSAPFPIVAAGLFIRSM